MSYLLLLQKRTLLPVLFLSTTLISLAQTATLKGTVKDASGNPLSGASVTLQGQSRGTTSKNDGTFSLLVNPGTLTVNASYVGFATARQTITVASGETSTIDFVLQESGQEQAVVILGSRSLPRTQLE